MRRAEVLRYPRATGILHRVRCYLSAFRIGNQAPRLRRLVGRTVEAAVIANAVDADPTPVRQARLEEAIAVLKGCFGPGAFSFAGQHYTIAEYDAARDAWS